ncbi:MAG: dihydrofolate reductase [Bacteroidales bacterium]
MQNVSIIAAVAQNRAIGKDNDLLWRLPKDMKRFKELTTGNTVVMGRRTFESLPKGALPNRKNIVLTSMPEAICSEAFVCSSWEELTELTQTDKDIFIIGGSSVYEDALKIANHMYITYVDAKFENADVFFPQLNLEEWEEVKREHHPADDKHAYSFTFVDYVRKNK